MDRGGSSKAHPPTLEKVSMARAPYMNSYPDYLSSNEKELRPALWTSQSGSSTRAKAATGGAMSKSNISGPIPSSPMPLMDARPDTPRAPVIPSRPVFIPLAPRTEPNLPSFVDQRKAQKPTIPAAPRTEPNLPSFVNPPMAARAQYLSPGSTLPSHPARTVKVPVTPADSAVGSFGRDTISSGQDAASEVIQRSTTGTSSVNVNCYAPPQPSHTCCCCCNRHKRPSRMTRWKSAVRGIFHRVSEDDVEHIKTSHWTDI